MANKNLTFPIVLYLDAYPGMNPNFAVAFATPAGPPVGRRYRLVFAIPDPNEPDADIVASSVEEAT